MSGTLKWLYRKGSAPATAGCARHGSGLFVLDAASHEVFDVRQAPRDALDGTDDDAGVGDSASLEPERGGYIDEWKVPAAPRSATFSK